MEEEKKQITVAPWLRQLLVGIIGTSIGLGLSFTVNRMVENTKQQKIQRETAMMAVYDIEEILRQLKEEKDQEEKMFNTSRYVLTHQDEMDSISPDTLAMVIDYLFDNPAAIKGWTVDTRENTFNSTMEIRRNLGDIHFYDNVQLCYQVRRELKLIMENDQAFKRPYNSEDYERFIRQMSGHEVNASSTEPQPQFRAKFLKMFFPNETISLYLQRYLQRKIYYFKAIGELERMDRENKYLMSITDKDMEEYVRQNVDRTQPATAAMIQGRWELVKDDYQDIYEINADSTMTRTGMGVGQVTLMLEAEKMDVPVTIPLKFQIKGKWTFVADTLKAVYDIETFQFLSFDLDLSALPKAALERNKDSIEIKKKAIKDFYTQAYKTFNYNNTSIVQFDISGNTMMWTDVSNKGYTDYLFRKEE